MIEFADAATPYLRLGGFTLVSLGIVWRLYGLRTVLAVSFVVSFVIELIEARSGSVASQPLAIAINALMRALVFGVVFVLLDQWLARYVQGERDRQLVSVLQRVSLPSHLEIGEGIRVDALYRAGHAEEIFGGDWYDAFALDDGRAILSIGDVAGSGLRAASTMAVARQAIRTAAQMNPDPGAVLSIVDRVLESQEIEDMVTAMVALYDRNLRRLEVASAGHLPLFLVHADGTLESPAVANGLPLGVRQRSTPPRTSLTVSKGDRAVFYTDGLVENALDINKGTEKLRALLETPAFRSATSPAAYVLEHLIGTDPRDDVAILVADF